MNVLREEDLWFVCLAIKLLQAIVVPVCVQSVMIVCLPIKLLQAVVVRCVMTLCTMCNDCLFAKQSLQAHIVSCVTTICTQAILCD